MPLLGSIVGAFGGQIVDSLLGKVTGVFEAHFKKQITIEELRTQVTQALLDTFAEIEKAHAAALAETYASFMGAVGKSKLMQVVWASVVLSQLAVLLWHQAGIPALCYFVGVKACYPSSGSTVEWAYLLIGALCGLGPLVLRSGPGAMSGDALKRMIGR